VSDWAGGRGRGWAGGRFVSPVGRAKTAAPTGPGDLTARWAPTVGRILLGLVLAWFGYHELLLPGEWTGYVPSLSVSGLSDTALRDVGVLGLAICLTGSRNQRLVLRG
jgi:hypothetical protein